MRRDYDGRVTVVIPAAGAGRRLGGEKKQYRLLGGEPMLAQSLKVFADLPFVRQMIVAMPEEEARSWRPIYGEEVVAGGATRQESVMAGLEAVSGETDIVLIHDAVRPFVTRRQIIEVVVAATDEGAAAVAVPATDTLRRGAEGRFSDTIDRSDVYYMQTPQGFRRELVLEVYEKARHEGISATDDVELVRRAGHPVRIVQGSARNMKVTTPDDWDLARLLWQSRQQTQP